MDLMDGRIDGDGIREQSASGIPSIPQTNRNTCPKHNPCGLERRSVTKAPCRISWISAPHQALHSCQTLVDSRLIIYQDLVDKIGRRIDVFHHGRTRRAMCALQNLRRISLRAGTDITASPTQLVPRTSRVSIRSGQIAFTNISSISLPICVRIILLFQMGGLYCHEQQFIWSTCQFDRVLSVVITDAAPHACASRMQSAQSLPRRRKWSLKKRVPAIAMPSASTSF